MKNTQTVFDRDCGEERELDAQVASKVMKLPNVGWYRRTSCRDGEWQPCLKDDVTPDMPVWKASLHYWHQHWTSGFSVPLFSTMNDAACNVLEHMERDGFSWSIHSEPGKECRVTFSKPGEREFVGVAPMLPKAVCLAALAACEKREADGA